MLARQVADLRIVVREVVELPDVFLDGVPLRCRVTAFQPSW
jgi:hypothetical protein